MVEGSLLCPSCGWDGKQCDQLEGPSIAVVWSKRAVNLQIVGHL